ncbi:MAG: CBS domain-containing protein [Parcubacteria group bacterium Gr01-1014_29]|nr:MAG: CBS domain-containing protein [Parcubacteria group bacterium Gr01-1014_29]
MEEDLKVKDIMTKEVVTVSPDMPISEAAKILLEQNFDGVPVVDKDNKLVGILTEYDLVSKGSALHLPTFQTILQNLQVFRKDKSQFQKEFEDISSLKVKDVMNNDPLTLPEGATFEETVAVFRDHHRVNPIPIINKENKVIGVVSRFDVLKPLHLLKT